MRALKSIASIPLSIAAIFAAVVWSCRLSGAHVQLAGPVCAGLVAVAAGIAGFAPTLRARPQALQLLHAGLFGTVLHLLAFIGLTIALIATRTVDPHGRFLFWILGGYWISLLNLVWLSRRWVVEAAQMAKAQN